MKSLPAGIAVLLSLMLGAAQAQPAKPAEGAAKASKPSKPAKQKGSASTGRSARPAFTPDPAYDASYKGSDMDGDGEVSKAEAAGNEPLVVGFFRADRNRDGKLNRKEYEALFHAKEKAEARAQARAQVKAQAQAKAQARAEAKEDPRASVGASARTSR